MAGNKGWTPPGYKENGASRGDPVGRFLTADGFLNSARSLAGPLRLGTEPRVGPKGAARNGSTDFDMDRLEQKPVDRIGVKYPETDKPVPLVSRELRGSNRRRED